MGRIRTIKPEFFAHSGLFDAEQQEKLPLRLAFAGLWTCCDREGRFKWRPRELKLAVLPYDDCDFVRVLDALSTRGFIVKYASKSDVFGYIPSWKHHQFINNKEPQSQIPNYLDCQPDDASATGESPVEHAFATRGVKEGKGREGKHATFTRPLWIPETVWKDFEEMRKKNSRAAHGPGKTEPCSRVAAVQRTRARRGGDSQSEHHKSMAGNLPG